MRLTALFSTSILCGFCLMALEMLGGRMLYPTFGSSIDVWAAVITVFILSLSVGYVLGGRLADRSKGNLALGWVILLSGVTFCTLPIYALSTAEALSSWMAGARFGVLSAALVLFFVPSLLLGMVSPMLVKLVFTRAEIVGTTIGTLYAIGSFGNVLGILVTDYVLLEHLPLNLNLIWMGVLLCLIGIAHLAFRVEVAKIETPAGAAP